MAPPSLYHPARAST